jgi:hypothetical protein
LAAFLSQIHQPGWSERLTRQTAQVAGEPAPGFETGDVDNGGGFIPLPNAERIAPNEPMNLVRLEVPRSTMIALGFEVRADRAEEAVEADVLLGADGVARAVRFLN